MKFGSVSTVKAPRRRSVVALPTNVRAAPAPPGFGLVMPAHFPIRTPACDRRPTVRRWDDGTHDERARPARGSRDDRDGPPPRDRRAARRGGRAPPAPPLGGLQEVHRLRLGRPARRAPRALGRRGLGGAAPAEALRAVPRRAARPPGGQAAHAQQRHRLPVPAAQRLRPSHRARDRQEPDALLVLEARSPDGGGGGHHALLFFPPPAGRHSQGFYPRSPYREPW